MSPKPDFFHEFVSGTSDRTLLLLHGTGGNEHDLIPLGHELDPKHHCSARAAKFSKMECRDSFAGSPKVYSTSRT
jgi:predicted esterase